jgi:hypothetical protein
VIAKGFNFHFRVSHHRAATGITAADALVMRWINGVGHYDRAAVRQMINQ